MELIYHYLWQYKMMGMPLKTTSGTPIQIINPGKHNTDAGPDFLGARLKIGSDQLCGNVEIHVKASDWHRHGHHLDPAYDNILLHVVALNDTAIKRSNGQTIPQCVAILPEGFYDQYARLKQPSGSPRCTRSLDKLSQLHITDWLESLTLERLHEKADRITGYFNNCGYDWDQTAFIALARGFGFNLNSLPFELMAKRLQINFLRRHADNPLQIEALLFGIAGLLDASRNIFDSYYQSLCREFSFLARKYSLSPIQPALWKYARTRPQNFPHRRIALLAAILAKDMRIATSIFGANADPEKLADIFNASLSPYWDQNGAFGGCGDNPLGAKTLSRASIISLLINVAVPLYYAYARHTTNSQLAEAALELLYSLPPEKNSKTAPWMQSGIKCSNAANSQALLQLTNQYCEADRCLQCRFGHNILRSTLH